MRTKRKIIIKTVNHMMGSFLVRGESRIVQKPRKKCLGRGNLTAIPPRQDKHHCLRVREGSEKESVVGFPIWDRRGEMEMGRIGGKLLLAIIIYK